MSRLIDSYEYSSNQTEINGNWYIAKPLNPFMFKERFKDAWRVFTGKSIAVHFKEDEK